MSEVQILLLLFLHKFSEFLNCCVLVNNYLICCFTFSQDLNIKNEIQKESINVKKKVETNL